MDGNQSITAKLLQEIDSLPVSAPLLAPVIERDAMSIRVLSAVRESTTASEGELGSGASVDQHDCLIPQNVRRVVDEMTKSVSLAKI